MKRTITLVFLTAIFYSCQIKEKTIRIPAYCCGWSKSIEERPKKDITYALFKVYEPKENLSVFLDSVIDYTLNYYGDEKYIQDFSVYPHTFVDELRLAITNKSMNCLRHDLYDAVFYYKGSRFFYRDGMLEKYFNATERVDRIKCVKPKKLEYVIHIRSLEWIIIVDEDKLQLSRMPENSE